MECLADRHGWRDGYHGMHVIVTDGKAMHGYPVPLRYLVQGIPAQIFMSALPKYLISAFRYPPDMVCRFAIAMAE